MTGRFLVIDKKILPEAYEKVVIARELLESGKVKSVSEAVKIVDISRSTFYKYKDSIFTLSESTLNKKVTINFLLQHNPGVLTNVLSLISAHSGNIVTIHQDIPINSIAVVTITFDIANLSVSLDEMIDLIDNISGVSQLNLIAVE